MRVWVVVLRDFTICVLWVCASASVGALLLSVGSIRNVGLSYSGKVERFLGQWGRDSSALQMIGEISLSDLENQMRNASVLLVDARPSIFFSLGHIPNAVSLPREEMRERMDEFVKKFPPSAHRDIVVYCSGEECNDSKMVAGVLGLFGYDRISIFSGGWNEWSDGNRAIETR